MKHELRRIKGGESPWDFMGWIRPECSCGWVGRKEYNYSSYQHSNLTDQEKRHVKEVYEEEI